MFLLYLAIAASASAADIRPLLREQGFGGPINGRETIRYVGQIHAGKERFQIYTYGGVFRAAAVDHGVNRLIVIRNGRRVLGTYNADVPIRCTIADQRVFCNAGVLRFSRHGPPPMAIFDGEAQTFSRAATW